MSKKWRNRSGNPTCPLRSRPSIALFPTSYKQSVLEIGDASRLKRSGDNESPNAQYSEDEIRRGFSSEIAFVMAYFKMNIDIYFISDSVYANFVRQAKTAAKEAAARK